jgi:hypothetical protein
MHVYRCVSIGVYVYVYGCVCLNISMIVYVCMYTCVYASTYTYIYTYTCIRIRPAKVASWLKHTKTNLLQRLQVFVEIVLDPQEELEAVVRRRALRYKSVRSMKARDTHTGVQRACC